MTRMYFNLFKSFDVPNVDSTVPRLIQQSSCQVRTSMLLGDVGKLREERCNIQVCVVIL